MTIQKIFSFLIFPGKNTDPIPEINGTEVLLTGKLYKSLENIYNRSEDECSIPIRFIPTVEEIQKNDMRDLIILLLKNQTIQNAKNIAERLSTATTRTPGLGLLFLILGIEQSRRKIVISRFPADEGILAETSRAGLTIQFLEKIFMKSLFSYKAVLYKDDSLDSGFWDGFLVDKQLKSRPNKVALYWLKDFLLSDFYTTSTAGSRRIGLAIRNATRETEDLNIKHELISTAFLLKGFSGQTISLESISNNLNISEDTKRELINQLPSTSLFSDSFEFDYDEFKNVAPFSSIELDNGSILMAPSGKFDDCFRKERIDNTEIFRFTTEGRVINEVLRGRR